MKKLFWILALSLFILSGCASSSNLPFSGRTKHKTVKRMKKKDVRNAQKGKTYYYRENGKVKKR